MTDGKYYSPTVSVDAEVSLSEFTNAQLIAEMNHRRGSAGASEANELSGIPSELEDHLRTLILAGQRTQAMQELSDYLEPIIGRLYVGAPCD